MAPPIHMQVSLTAPASWDGYGNSTTHQSYTTTATRDPRAHTPVERPLDTLPRWPAAPDSNDCTLYNLLPEDVSACSLNQEDPFE